MIVWESEVLNDTMDCTNCIDMHTKEPTHTYLAVHAYYYVGVCTVQLTSDGVQLS